MRYDNKREDVTKLLTGTLGYTRVRAEKNGNAVYCKMMHSIPVAIKVSFSEKLYEIYNIMVFWDVGHEEWLKDKGVAENVEEFGPIFTHAREMLEADLIMLYNAGAGIHVHNFDKFPEGAISGEGRTKKGGRRKKNTRDGAGKNEKKDRPDFKLPGEDLSWYEQGEFGEFLSDYNNDGGEK